MVNSKRLGVHKSIEPILYLDIGDLSVSAEPKRLFTVGYPDTFKGQSIHLSKGFRRFNEAVKKPHIAIVPQRGTVGLCEMTIPALHILTFPDDISALKITLDSLYMAGFLESGFPLANRNPLQTQVSRSIQGTLT